MRKPKVEIAMEFVTPTQAREWLRDNNPNNRNIVERTVAKYANDIMNDAWVFNSSGIGFDVSGNLTNGQHRLRAISDANKGIYALIVRGLSLDSIKNEDQQKTRGISGINQILHPEQKNQNARAARVRALAEGFGKTKTALSYYAYEYWYGVFEHSIEWSLQVFPSGGGEKKAFSRASVCASFICAHGLKQYSSKVDELATRIVNNDRLETGTTPHTLHRYITATAPSISDSAQIFRQVCYALKLFLDSENRVSIKDTDQGVVHFLNQYGERIR